MSKKPNFVTVRLGLIGVLLASSCPLIGATGATLVTLPGSTKTVEALPATGTANPQAPFISRQTLTAAETDAPLEFEVPLKMRNFADLQARVNRGERISPAEMAAKYEPSASDYQAVVDWLQGEGFTVTRQDPHHLAVFARGKIGQIAQALRVQFARVTSEGKEYTSAVTAPSVPSNISSLIIGINGLQPHIRAHKHLIKQQLQPNASGGSGSYLPGQIAQAYGATSLYNTNITGGGQTIAIVIDTFPSTTDLLLFWKTANINQSISNMQFIQVVAGTLPVPSGEESLDVEWASAMAPGAHVRVYATTDLGPTDLDKAYGQIYDDATNHPELGIHQMSMSYGEGETYSTSTQANTDDRLFMMLAGLGMTIFASSGDGGSTPGANGAGDESGRVQVETPASDPYVTGVGGTSLMLDSSNNTTSEVVWNDSPGASGGGTSIYFGRPAWQTGAGVPALVSPQTTPMRLVPDVAATADPNFGAVYYLNGVQTVVGGTSWASPIWAGLCALFNQGRANAGQTSLGVLGPSIYPLLGTANYPTDIRDIISGNNATSGSSGNYASNAGYDMATGIGSPKSQALAQTLVGASTLIGVQMPVAEQLILPGQNATFSVAVGGTSATYQWQRMPVGTTTWNNITDDSTYSGSATASLTVTDANMAMNGDLFQCVMTLSGNSVTTTPSVLTVDTPLVISALAGAVGLAALKNGTGTSANFNVPSGIALDSSGNLYIADFSNNNIRKVTSGGVVTTPYGSATGRAGSTDASGNGALFTTPNGIAFDSTNNLFYVADTGNNLIRKINSASVTTFAGAGGTLFNAPESLAVDSSGNVYVADTNNDVIRKITPGGTVSVIAGQVGTAGYQDGSATTQALLNQPNGIAVDGSGNVYVADYGNDVVRVISSGVVSTLAGQPGVGGYVDGPGARAYFNAPVGITVDGSGNVYVADCLIPTIGSNAGGADLIRKITPTGVVSTIAGQSGNEGSANGTGTAAQFYSVQAVALNNTTGTFYFADAFNQTIRQGTLFNYPILSLTATQPNAMIFGPTPGQFTVTRTGATTSALTVDYTTAGTAISGIDYTATLTGSVTIPAGASTATITVNPISDPQASSPTLQLTLTGNNGYTIGSPSTATVTIAEITPFQTWETNEFGANATDPNIGGALADPNHNGVPNFLEYAFNTDPLQAGNAAQPALSVVQDGSGNNYLALTFTELNTDSNLAFEVQVTRDLTQQTDQWHSGPTYTTVVSQTVTGSTTQVTVRDNTPFTPVEHRYIRVQVSGD